VNCLNFGNPEHPEVMWQFTEVVDGMSAACTALPIPVVGGNVSFYNESLGHDIDPTPVVGVLGIVDELDDRPPPAALAGGTRIVVLGETANELGGSEWAAVVHGLDGGMPPRADTAGAHALHELVRALVSGGLVDGCDFSEGDRSALAEWRCGRVRVRRVDRRQLGVLSVGVTCRHRRPGAGRRGPVARGHGWCCRRRRRRGGVITWSQGAFDVALSTPLAPDGAIPTPWPGLAR
jgi:hypothetical protein